MAQTKFICGVCQRSFASKSAKKQHKKAKHESESDTPSTPSLHFIPPPPVDTLGEWVVTRDFCGRKSFGYFQCFSNCRKTWTSAHAYQMYAQGCKSCNRMSEPLYMWQNDSSTRTYSDKEKSKGPHDHERCEACTAGVCDSGATELH